MAASDGDSLDSLVLLRLGRRPFWKRSCSHNGDNRFRRLQCRMCGNPAPNTITNANGGIGGAASERAESATNREVAER